jgi:hypothetical protein
VSRQIGAWAVICLVVANWAAHFGRAAAPVRASTAVSAGAAPRPGAPGAADAAGLPAFAAPPFAPSELAAATAALGFPAWSRGFVNCTHARSEVTCGQVVCAWRAIRAWERAVAASGNTGDAHAGVVHTRALRAGIGNRVMQEMVGAVIAMVSGRAVSVVCRSPNNDVFKDRNDYEYPATGVIRYAARECPGPDVDVPSDGRFFATDFTDAAFRGKHLRLKQTTLSSMAYMHPTLSAFCIRHFGAHAQFFVMNYIMRIPQRYIDFCRRLTEGVPATVRLFGVHLRYHYADNFYSITMERTLSIAVPFCLDVQAQRPTAFAFATDNWELFVRFGKAVKVISVPGMIREPDRDHDSALMDLTLLMICEDWLLSARSTFSALVALRVARRFWLIEKYANTIYLVSHSQVAHFQTPMYMNMVQWKPFDISSLGNIGSPGQETAMRYFFRYFVL